MGPMVPTMTNYVQVSFSPKGSCLGPDHQLNSISAKTEPDKDS